MGAHPATGIMAIEGTPAIGMGMDIAEGIVIRGEVIIEVATVGNRRQINETREPGRKFRLSFLASDCLQFALGL